MPNEIANSINVEQFVMAYGVEHDRLRAIVPDSYESIRPVIRINAEIRNRETAYLEVNTPVAHAGRRGWLNITVLKDVAFVRRDNSVTFTNDKLEISFAATGIQGGCPAEKDNDGCFYINQDQEYFTSAEKIDAHKEYCDCSFRWLACNGTSGQSIGETLPAIPEDVRTVYPAEPFCLNSASKIPCRQVLGSYKVEFLR